MFNLEQDQPHTLGSEILIADKSGNSVVVEFIDKQIRTKYGTDSWQVVTNFTLTTDRMDGVGKDRYAIIEKELGEKNGILDKHEAMDLLKSVSHEGTIWSIIYNLSTGEVNVVMDRKYDKTIEYRLES